MDNKIEVFKNEQFGEVRTILEGETLLFCGSDIAKALGYARPGKAIIDHCKGVLKRDTLTSGGMQSLSYIPEGDVYRLIVHSKLPAAEKFEHWLFDEVVPTIRKTGGYMTVPSGTHSERTCGHCGVCSGVDSGKESCEGS